MKNIHIFFATDKTIWSLFRDRIWSQVQSNYNQPDWSKVYKSIELELHDTLDANVMQIVGRDLKNEKEKR